MLNDMMIIVYASRQLYIYLMYLSGVDALARFMSMGLNERESLKAITDGSKKPNSSNNILSDLNSCVTTP
jgi:hypothetical protein